MGEKVKLTKEEAQKIAKGAKAHGKKYSLSTKKK